jgi:multidrug efflux pump subunit AcrA (membrane-fusion protein)
MTTSHPNNSASASAKVPLHKKYTKRVSKSAPQLPNFDAQALAIASAGLGDTETRDQMLKLAIIAAQGIGGFFATRTDEHWHLAKQKPAIGKVPSSTFFDEAFSEKCSSFLQSGQVQTYSSEALEGALLFTVPIHTGQEDPELMLVVGTKQSPIVEATQRMTRIAAAMRLWMNARAAKDSNWQVKSLASIIAMVSQIESQTTVKSASEETVNLMANHLMVTGAAIGTIEDSKMKLKAISGVSKLDGGSQTSRGWLNAMVESETRKEAGIFPAVNEENNFLLQAHRQLASSLQTESVFSQPLVTEDENVVGALVFSGEAKYLQSNQFLRFNATAAPAIAAALHSAKQRQKGRISRGISWLTEKAQSNAGKLTAAAMLGFILLMLVPITYRVRCTAITEPVSRRFAVAPFAGQIIEGYVEAGDFVTAGQVMAEMDGRTIRWELFGVAAERKQSVTSRGMELSDRNIPKAILAELEHDRLQSEEEVLRYKQEHLQVKSPIDGIVLSGSLERSEAASVETGQTLFEIGPIKPMRIEIEIPANEVAQTKPGFPVKIWIDGQEDNVIKGEILKIHPRSSTRNAQNVFIAEVEFPNEDERLRPGMKGTVRIDCERRSIGWSMFHKPINWMKANFSYF